MSAQRLLRGYMYHLKDLGLAPASIRRNVSAARTYFRFLLSEGHSVVSDPSERLGDSQTVAFATRCLECR